jgi:hypothetical protein
VTSEFVAGTEPEAAAQDGVPLPTQPQVQLRDQSGNPVAAGFNVTVTVTAGWTLGGTTTVPTNGAGIATFTNLQIQGPAGGPMKLTFNAAGVAVPLESVDITLSAELAARILRTVAARGL